MGVKGELQKLMRTATIVLLGALGLLWLLLLAGLRYNGSDSLPVGVYMVQHKVPEKGDVVFVRPPELPVFIVARDRGYLDVAASPAEFLVKRIAAVEGETVTIDASGVHVNGIRLANSVPLPFDTAGRPLQPFLLNDYILRPGEVLLMSDYNPRSFDGRYFGPLDSSAIESVVFPLWTH